MHRNMYFPHRAQKALPLRSAVGANVMLMASQTLIANAIDGLQNHTARGLRSSVVQV